MSAHALTHLQLDDKANWVVGSNSSIVGLISIL